MKKTIFRGAPVPFVMELPNYRFPSAKTVLLLMWDKGKDFLQRAFTVIFVATVVVWALQSFDIRLNPVEDGANSMLAAIGQLISPIFAPVGFSDWRAATALITGFIAKEAVISTLAVLTGSGIAELHETIREMFTPLAAMSFLVFTLLYTPCVAAVATVKREFGRFSGAALMVLYQTGFAWLAAFAVYQLGRLIGLVVS
jgi:ferrous iron transport protein B